MRVYTEDNLQKTMEGLESHDVCLHGDSCLYSSEMTFNKMIEETPHINFTFCKDCQYWHENKFEEVDGFSLLIGQGYCDYSLKHWWRAYDGCTHGRSKT